MVVVSRKDKLAGFREIVGGAIELVTAADQSEEASFRRITASVGATSIIAGLGRLRGARLIQATGSLAGIAVVARGILTTLQQRRRSADRGSAASTTTTGAAGPSRREWLRGVNDVVGGLLSLAIAADRSLERHERFAAGAIGVGAVSSGIGRLRQLEPAKAIAGTSYLVALGSGALAAIRRRRS